jgi:hypothetical protein
MMIGGTPSPSGSAGMGEETTVRTGTMNETGGDRPTQKDPKMTANEKIRSLRSHCERTNHPNMSVRSHSVRTAHGRWAGSQAGPLAGGLCPTFCGAKTGAVGMVLLGRRASTSEGPGLAGPGLGRRVPRDLCCLNREDAT